MSIISTNNLGLSFGTRKLFAGVTISINLGDHIGLIGQNGAGKTSLIKTLLGTIDPSVGSVQQSRNSVISILSQDEAVDSTTADPTDYSLYETMINLFGDLQEREKELRRMEENLGTASEIELEQYGKYSAAFEQDGGYDYVVRTEQTLSGLGFRRDEWQRSVSTFSGGERTRLRLARLLLSHTDLLILDEPTNHLDISAIEWLENELRNFKQAILVVSHDRRFLDTVANKTWELSEKGVDAYTGGYSFYLKQRDERRAAYIKLFDETKRRLVQQADFISKNIARASSTAQATGLLKRVYTDLMVIEQFGIEALNSNTGLLGMGYERTRTPSTNEVIKWVHALTPEKRKLTRPRFILSPSSPVKRELIKGESLLVGYDQTILFLCEKLNLHRGERLAIHGPNGSGKSSLLRIILGEQNLLEGELSVDQSVKPAYFSQSRSAIAPEIRVIETLTESRGMNEQAARSLLAKWLFPGESAFKRVSQLSGGERTRLELSLLAEDGINLLILDEPTNHLDLESREALQEAVLAWDGTVLFVSHDRWFTDIVATRIMTIDDGILY